MFEFGRVRSPKMPKHRVVHPLRRALSNPSLASSGSGWNSSGRGFDGHDSAGEAGEAGGRGSNRSSSSGCSVRRRREVLPASNLTRNAKKGKQTPTGPAKTPAVIVSSESPRFEFLFPCLSKRTEKKETVTSTNRLNKTR